MGTWSSTLAQGDVTSTRDSFQAIYWDKCGNWAPHIIVAVRLEIVSQDESLLLTTVLG